MIGCIIAKGGATKILVRQRPPLRQQRQLQLARRLLQRHQRYNAQTNIISVIPQQYRMHSSLPSSSSASSSSVILPSDPNNTNDNLPSTERLIDFQTSSKIEGEESHIATVQLRPGEILRAEAGAMIYMTEGIVMDTTLAGVSSAFSRMMTGQNVFLTDFKYEGKNGEGTVALGTDFPSKIMRFSLEDYPNATLICQRGAFLASNPTVNIEMEFTKSLSAGFFGGQGFVLQKLHGEGDVLIKGGGTIVRKDLSDGETIRVTSGSLVAFESTVQYDVQMMPGIKNAMFGGEGLFVTTLQGPGSIWLQGMPADRMIAEIARRVPAGGPGIGIPIGVGGSSGAGADDVAAVNGDDGVSEDGTEAAEGIATDDGIAAATAGDEAINADRQATVMSSEDSSNVDSESPSALFGDAVPEDAVGADASGDDVFGDVRKDTSNVMDDFSSTSTSETTFMDDDYEEDFSTSSDFKDGELYNDDTFDSSDSIDDTSFDTEGISEDAQEQASSILKTLWDIFTGDD